MLKSGLFRGGCLLALMLVTIALYWMGLSGPFLLDDTNNILPTQLSHFDLNTLLSVAFDNHSGPLGRPLSIISFSLSGLLLGFSPFSYKLVNLGLHLLIGGLIYRLAYLLFNKTTSAASCRTMAFFCAALWLLHPIHVSTVLYSVQRMTQLSTLFTLLGVIAYIQLREKENWPGIFISFFCCLALAAFSKESGLLLGFYLLAVEICFFRFKGDKALPYLRLFFSIAVLLPLIMGGLYVFMRWENFLARYQAYGFSMSERLLTEPQVLWFYIQQILLPRLSAFALFHDDFPLSTNWSFSVIAAIGAWIFTLFIACRRFRYSPIFLFALLWFCAGHLLESTLFPLELVFEHRNYLASFGLFWGATWGIFWLFSRFSSHRYFLYWVLFFLLAILSSLTAIRSYTWSDESLFLKVAVIEHPNSARAHGEWGNALAKRGDINGAIVQLGRSAELSPHNSGPIVHQILLHCALPHLSEIMLEQALQATERLVITPYTINSLENLSRAALANQCQSVDAEAILLLARNMLENPSIAHNPYWAALAGIITARAFWLDGQIEHAFEQYDAAFSIYPSRLPTLIEKATLAASSGHFKQASYTLKRLEKLTNGAFISYDAELNKLRQLMNAGS